MDAKQQNRIMREALENIGKYAEERAMCSIYLENISDTVKAVLEEINKKG